MFFLQGCIYPGYGVDVDEIEDGEREIVGNKRNKYYKNQKHNSLSMNGTRAYASVFDNLIDLMQKSLCANWMWIEV